MKPLHIDALKSPLCIRASCEVSCKNTLCIHITKPPLYRLWESPLSLCKAPLYKGFVKPPLYRSFMKPLCMGAVQRPSVWGWVKPHCMGAQWKPRCSAKPLFMGLHKTPGAFQSPSVWGFCKSLLLSRGKRLKCVYVCFYKAPLYESFERLRGTLQSPLCIDGLPCPTVLLSLSVLVLCKTSSAWGFTRILGACKAPSVCRLCVAYTISIE